MNHSFNPNIARVMGVEDAIVVEFLAHQVRFNEVSQINHYDGDFYVRGSANILAEVFNFWTKSKIARILKRLENDDCIKSEYLDEHGMERAKWYTIKSKSIKAVYGIRGDLENE